MLMICRYFLYLKFFDFTNNIVYNLGVSVSDGNRLQAQIRITSEPGCIYILQERIELVNKKAAKVVI